MGYNFSGPITNSFWNTTTSGQATSAGGTGKTSAQMRQLSTFSSWNSYSPNTIANIGASGAVWRIYEGRTTPLLTSFLTPLTLAIVSKTYNKISQTGIVNGALLGQAAIGINVGNYSHSYYSTQQGYDIVGGNLTITPKAITMSGLSVAASKVYDGTTKATVSGTKTLAVAEAVGTGNTSDGKWYIGDMVSITGSAVGTYNSKDVATASTVTYSGLSLTGSQAGNYSLRIQSPASAKITKKTATMSGLSVAASKVYDGTTKATVSGTKTLAAAEAVGQGTTTDGKIYIGDTVSLTGTAVGTYNSKDVATASTVTYSGLSLTGGQAGNYTFTIQSPARAKITKKTITLSASKTYDGTTTLGSGKVTIGTGVTVNGITELLGYSGATANSKNVVDNTSNYIKTITLLNGTGGLASNYALPSLNHINAPVTITPKALTMSVLSVAASKVYDGKSSALVTGTKTLAVAEAVGVGNTSDGKSYTGDSVSLIGTAVGTYNSKDVATASKVTFSGLSLTGGQAGNYTLTSQSPASARITKKTVTLSASKAYDGTTTLGVGTVTIGTGVTVNGITELLGYSGATANSKIVADNATNYIKTITLQNGTGSLASNYTLPTLNHTNAPVTITPKALTMSGLSVAPSKVYDGTTKAVVTGTKTLATAESVGTGTASDGKSYTGDNVNLTGTAAGTYNSKDVATASTVTYSGLSLTGNQAGNYTLRIQSPASARITKKTVTLSASKTYDNSTTLGVGTVTIGTGVTVNGITELLGYSGATSYSNSIKDNTSNYIKTITLLNGTGGLASNYALPTLNHSTAPVTIK